MREQLIISATAIGLITTAATLGAITGHITIAALARWLNKQPQGE